MKIGGNFATNADAFDEGVEFYLLKFINPRQKAKKSVKDKWENLIKRGAYYVTGLWYEVQADGQHYILLDDKPEVFILSHLVRSIKFPMSQMGARFYLDPKVDKATFNSMPYDTLGT